MTQLTNDQKYQLNKLVDHRDSISNSLFHIERILKEYFPQEYDIAYQHWIPQMITALYEDNRWLSRGEHNMQDTIDHINDSQSGSGVKKYI